MAGRIQGITIELDGNATKLDKALSSVNKEIKNTQTQLKDVEKLLRLDPKNVTLLEQKARLLAQAFDETKKKLDTLKDAQRQMDANGIDKNSEQYQGLQREIIETENELKRLAEQSKTTTSRMQQVADVTKQISEKTGDFAEKTKGLSLAAAGVVTAIGAMALKAVTASDDLNTLAQQTGFSTAELQKMQYAADTVDVSMETITSAATRMKRQMGSTSSSTREAFERIGVSVRDANGEMRNSTEVFWEVIEGLSRIENETERDTVAMQLFGKSADQLAGIVDDGGEAFRKMGKQAEDLGLILSQETLNGLNDVNDKLDGLKAQLKGVLAVNGAKVIEAFLPLIESAANGVGKFAEKLADLDAGQIKTIATLAALVAGISPASKAISVMSGAVSSLATAFPKIVAALGNPTVLAITGVATAIGLIVKAAHDSQAEFKEMTKASGDLEKTMKNADKSFNDATTRINVNASAARTLVKRLEDLEKAGLDTAAAQQQYASTVGQLNEMFPELNLSIEENTGLVDGGTAAIYRNIDALKEQMIAEAMREHFAEIMGAYAEAQLEVATNEAKLKDALQERARIEAEEQQRIFDLTVAQNAYTAAVVAYGADSKEARAALENYNRVQAESYEKEMQLVDATNQNNKTINDLRRAIDKGNDTLDDYQGQIDEASAVMSDLAESTIGANDTTQDLIETIEDASDPIEDLAKTYESCFNKARSSIDGQVKLFDTFESTLTGKTSTIEGILETWGQQTQNLAEYTENLQKAAQYGIDDGLIKSLADGSPESAAYLAVIIGAIEDADKGIGNLGGSAEEAVAKINSAFSGTTAAKDDLATVIAQMDEAWQEAVDSAPDIGENFVQGIINGMKNRQRTLSQTARASALEVVRIYRTAWDENSPSKVAAELGRFWDEGLAVGIEKNGDAVEDAATDIAQIMTPVTTNNMSTVNNTSNLGGVYVTVNASAGQDVTAIAEAVMEEIQAAVEREGAAL